MLTSPAGLWTRLWMRFAGLSRLGRIAARLAVWFTPPYKGRASLGWMNERGFVSPTARISHRALRLGKHVFVGEHVIIYQAEGGGPVEIDDGASLYGDNLIETGQGGRVRIGEGTRLQRGCQLVAYQAAIDIGRDVGLAPNCVLSCSHPGSAPGELMSGQPPETKGPIVIEDHVWLGVGVTILDGVRIGRGAVIGAGAVVTRDIPAGAIAVGVPAHVVKMREARVWSDRSLEWST